MFLWVEIIMVNKLLISELVQQSINVFTGKSNSWMGALFNGRWYLVPFN